MACKAGQLAWTSAINRIRIKSPTYILREGRSALQNATPEKMIIVLDANSLIREYIVSSETSSIIERASRPKREALSAE
jgi:hypothetical protein